jgi:pimeloyl-ACP methyl ester carboxylesterase
MTQREWELDVTTTENPAIGKSAEANGIRTNYLEEGEGFHAGNEHIVLIHGSGPGVTSYANWRLVLPELAEDFHVVAPDMVGFGYSDRPVDVNYSLDTWADQTLGLMDTLGIEKANIVGNSFGGGIALRIATKHPDRVGKLVLMGSMGVHFPITEGLDAVWGYDGTLDGMRTVLDYFAYSRVLVNDELAQVRYEGANEPGFQEAFSSMFPAPRQRWVEAMMVAEDEIRALPHRALIVHGREDQVIPLANSRKLMELLDNADLSVFSHCGHWSMIERTADFNRLTRDFFLGD